MIHRSNCHEILCFYYNLTNYMFDSISIRHPSISINIAINSNCHPLFRIIPKHAQTKHWFQCSTGKSNTKLATNACRAYGPSLVLAWENPWEHHRLIISRIFMDFPMDFPSKKKPPNLLWIFLHVPISFPIIFPLKNPIVIPKKRFSHHFPIKIPLFSSHCSATQWDGRRQGT